MDNNIFFGKKNIKLSLLFPKTQFKKDIKINNVKPLHNAKKNDLTFFDSIKYKNLALKTKASICIRTIRKPPPFEKQQ